MDLRTRNGEESSKYAKTKSEEQKPKGKFLGKWITCDGICSRGLSRRRITGVFPCRRIGPCRRVLPCRRTLPCRGLYPWRRSRSRWRFGGGFRALLVGLLCSYTHPTIKISVREKRNHERLSARSRTINLRWGLRWGLLCEVVAGSGKVGSGTPLLTRWDRLR